MSPRVSTCHDAMRSYRKETGGIPYPSRNLPCRPSSQYVAGIIHAKDTTFHLPQHHHSTTAPQHHRLFFGQTNENQNRIPRFPPNPAASVLRESGRGEGGTFPIHHTTAIRGYNGKFQRQSDAIMAGSGVYPCIVVHESRSELDTPSYATESMLTSGTSRLSYTGLVTPANRRWLNLA